MTPVCKDKEAHGPFALYFSNADLIKDLDQIQQTTIGNDYVLFKLDAFK